MKVKDMNEIQIQEMIMRWDIEYEQSYLDSIERGDIAYSPNTPELEMLQEHESAVQRIQQATNAYLKFRSDNAEWFI